MTFFFVLFPVVAFFGYIQLYSYMSKRERNLKTKMKEIQELAQEHRFRYNNMAEDDYWKGRRDEAGWFADVILDAIFLEIGIEKRWPREQHTARDGWVCSNCAFDRQQSGVLCVNCGQERPNDKK